MNVRSLFLTSLVSLVAACGVSGGANDAAIGAKDASVPDVGSSASVASAKAIAVGASYTCAVLDDNSVKCWGDNEYAQLGLGHTSNRGGAANEMGDQLSKVELGTGHSTKALATGRVHACAILDDDSVKCWGSNYAGQLGVGRNLLGDDAREMGDALSNVSLGTGRTAKAITTGGSHTCAILDDDSVKCWGSNYAGQLGLGDTLFRGHEGKEMGDNLPNVPLGTGRTAKAITAGESHTCAILDDNSVKCWGSGFHGQVGQGDRSHRGDDAGEMGDALSNVSLGTGRTAKAITAGKDHTCALLDDNRVKCWGDNQYGQLGQGDTSDRGGDANEMGDQLLKVDLGSDRTAKALEAGSSSSHTCAILDDNSVKCWGCNFTGQLGLGDRNHRGDGADEMGNRLSEISIGTARTAKALARGNAHTCAILDDNSVKCWGANTLGQLGQGDTSDRGGEANQMGDQLPTIDLGTK